MKLPSNLLKIITGQRPDLDPLTVGKYQRLAREQYGWDGGLPVVDLSCVHRGEKSGTVGCQACGGTKEIEVFECALHDECALEANVEDIRDCGGCGDRQTPEVGIVEGEAWAVGVTTAPRPQPTLKACVDSLLANNWHPTVYAEPGSDLSGIAVPVHQNEQKLGVLHNWLSMVRDLLRRYPDARWIITCQDDAALTVNVRRYIEQAGIPDDAGAVSLYTSAKYTKGKKRPPGLFRVPWKNFWGSCAMIFPRHIAEQMVDNPVISAWKWASIRRKQIAKNPDQIKHVDTAIGNTLEAVGKPIYCCHPSLSQHIAEQSSIGHGGRSGNRRAWKVSRNPLVDCVPKRAEKKFDFRTYAQLARDCRDWACRLQGEVSAVCGIPRAGVLAASVLAEELHVPLVSIETVVNNSPPWRPEHSRDLISGDLPILVVDDSSTSGRTLNTTRQKLSHRSDLLFGALYCTERAAKATRIDASGYTIQVGHSFEWILFRDYWCRAYAVDLDGVLSVDWSGDEEAEPERYRQHLRDARALVVPTRKLYAIVTARMEKHRAETEQWLQSRGIQYEQLIMHPAKASRDRNRDGGPGKWKAGVYSRLKKAVLFIESCPNQSRRIFEISRKPSLCYPTMEFYS